MTTGLGLAEVALGRLPDGVAFVLHPHAAGGLAAEQTTASRHGWSSRRTTWKVVKCYELEDAALLAAGLPGLAPLVMVARTEKTGPELAAAVRDRVDAQVPDLEAQANLLAVCQVFGELRYNDPRVFEILGADGWHCNRPGCGRSGQPKRSAWWSSRSRRRQRRRKPGAKPQA